MSNFIASHGSPTGSVFGNVGDIIGTNEGKVYVKYSGDSLNVGWEVPRPTPPTPSNSPTPTPTKPPLEPLKFDELIANGCSECENECTLVWSLDSSAILRYEVNWTKQATSSDPVLIIGSGTSSLTDGRTAYDAYFDLPSGNYRVGFVRQSTIFDTVNFRISVHTGEGLLSSAKFTSYLSGSATSVNMTANGITGYYVYHTRNLSGLLDNGTGGEISEVLNNITQTLTAINKQVPSTELLEIVGYNEKLHFTPKEIKECQSPSPSPTQTPTPTVSTTQTPTPTVTSTASPTPTPTVTPSVTPTIGTIPGTPTPTPTQTSTVTHTPTPTVTSTPTPTVTPSPSRIGIETMWIDYDENGHASASWLDQDAEEFQFSSTGSAFTNAYVAAIAINSLILNTGTNIRYAPYGAFDPRGPSGAAYQIDAKTNAFGIYDFDYMDPYNVPRNAYGRSTPNTEVYAVACARDGSVITVNKGSAAISSRNC